MGTLYRKVAVSERLPPPMTDVLIKYRWNGYFEPYHYFDDLHCKDEMLNEVTHWIEEIPDTTTQIQADKAELLELMTEMKESFDHKAWVTGMELKYFSSRIESLIQKMKKCQENTPR